MKAKEILKGKAQARITLMAAGALCLPGAVSAASYLLEPAVSLQTGYDDNFSLTEDMEDEVVINRLVADLTLSRFTETVEFEALARLDFVEYSGDDEDLENEDNELLNFVLENQITPRSVFGLDGIFKRDSLLRTTEVFADPSQVEFEPDDDVDANLVRQDIRRERFSVTPSYEYQLTPLSSIFVAYEYTDVSHEDADEVTVTDFDTQTATLGYSKALTPTLGLSTGISYIQYESDRDTEYDSVTLEGGLTRDFSETFSAGFTVGVRETEFETPTEDGDETGYLAGFTATKLGEVTRYNFRIQRRLSPSSSGDQVQSDQIAFNATRELSPRASIALNARYFDNENLQDDEVSTADREYLTIEPVFRWAVTPNWSVDLTYRYRQEERERPASIDGESNAAFITLNWARPIELDR